MTGIKSIAMSYLSYLSSSEYKTLAGGNNISTSGHNLTCSLLLSDSHYWNLAAILRLVETVQTVDCAAFSLL